MRLYFRVAQTCNSDLPFLLCCSKLLIASMHCTPPYGILDIYTRVLVGQNYQVLSMSALFILGDGADHDLYVGPVCLRASSRP